MGMLTGVFAILGMIAYARGSIFSVGHVSYVGRGGKIRFENVLSDDDNSWNYFRGHFKCKDPGYYYISFHGLSRRNDALTLNLHHNFNEALAGFGDGSGYNTASNSAILYLARGDTISLHIVEGNIHESGQPNRNYATLSGYKIGGGAPPPPFSPSGGQGGGGPTSTFGGAPGGSFAASPGGGQEGQNEDDFKPLTPDAGGP
ncbi:complement C1q-like protein 2 [Pollicipes pollicipes]|uniref:complement C1q-like protein 2 n=1 Tax=Pollicipes pollicipes TaxID=41117 RepID=UPI0018855711|nr:complement C1q-like protein 2 [Pollicipes pollicipes]